MTIRFVFETVMINQFELGTTLSRSLLLWNKIIYFIRERKQTLLSYTILDHRDHLKMAILETDTFLELTFHVKVLLKSTNTLAGLEGTFLYY